VSPGASARSVTAELSGALADLAGRPLPDRVSDAAKAVVLDGLGCLVAGALEEPAVIAGRYAAAGGGRGAATVVAGGRADPASAAFANGIALHCLDYEVVGKPPCHGTSSILPALLALAECEGSSGEDVLRAFALGWDVECRLRTAGSLRAAFHPSGVYGPIAAAAACAVLLGLGCDGIETAIGLAASSAGGLVPNVPTMTKAAHAGNAARTGVQSALLAGAGFTAAGDIVGIRRGFADAFLSGPPIWDLLNHGWGRHFYLADPGVNFKRYPVQYPLQTVVEAVLAARPADFALGDLDRVELAGSRHVIGRSAPFVKNGHAAKFSVEYCAAIALLTGEVQLESFSDDVVRSPAVRSVVERIRVGELPDDRLGKYGVSVRVMGAVGPDCAVERANHRGSIANPLSAAERRAKVGECFAHAGKDDVVGEVVELVEHVDQLPHVREIASRLSCDLDFS
jgi:2-methylcitrate dehydratase PrpD